MQNSGATRMVEPSFVTAKLEGKFPRNRCECRPKISTSELEPQVRSPIILLLSSTGRRGYSVVMPREAPRLLPPRFSWKGVVLREKLCKGHCERTNLCGQNNTTPE